jgi:amidase
VIRPAAFNGVVGLKPSFGAIPRTGVHPLSPSLDHVGIFARRVDDVAFALSLLAGASDSDPHGRPLPGFHVDVDRGLEPLEKPRLGIVRFEKWSRVETEQQDAFDAAITRLRDAGAVLEELELSELDQINWSTINTILACEGAAIFADLVARHPDRTSDHLKSLVEAGKKHSAIDYLSAKAMQETRKNAFAGEMSGYEALLTLPAFGEAPRGLHYTGDAEFCAPWTFLGVPAATLPVGFGKNRLPLGIQIVGGYRNDLRMLRLAKWIENTLRFDAGLAPAQ